MTQFFSICSFCLLVIWYRYRDISRMFVICAAKTLLHRLVCVHCCFCSFIFIVFMIFFVGSNVVLKILWLSLYSLWISFSPTIVRWILCEIEKERFFSTFLLCLLQSICILIILNASFGMSYRLQPIEIAMRAPKVKILLVRLKKIFISWLSCSWKKKAQHT